MRTTYRWVWRSLDPWPNAMSSMQHLISSSDAIWAPLSTVHTICSSASIRSAGSAAKYHRCLVSFQNSLAMIWWCIGGCFPILPSHFVDCLLAARMYFRELSKPITSMDFRGNLNRKASYFIGKSHGFPVFRKPQRLRRLRSREPQQSPAPWLPAT